MDILTHTLCGVAAGTVLASFTKKKWKEKLTIMAFSGIGGAFPDIDAVSMWSKFDVTIGKIFHLTYLGKDIYTAKLWYSHHAFFHSILAGFIFTLLIGVIFYILKLKSDKNILHSFKIRFLILLGFFSGYFIHLLCDMPTPFGAWGGVELFFPSKSYIGGSGQIWWWNNYDIFLIVVCVIIINLFLLFIPKIKEITAIIFTIGLISCFHQINLRKTNFNQTEYKTNYAKSEIKSKEIQREILGKTTYNLMIKFDNMLLLNF